METGEPFYQEVSEYILNALKQIRNQSFTAEKRASNANESGIANGKPKAAKAGVARKSDKDLDLIVPKHQDEQQEKNEEQQPKGSSRGYQLTSEGPGEYPESGDILSDPNLVWTEDRWDESRVAEARERIEKQGGCIAPFWRSQYVEKAGKFWHKFYKRNSDHFYKDRHYLHIVFPELGPDYIFENNKNSDPNASINSSSGNTATEGTRVNLLEVGCGVGNAFFPLLELNPRLHVTGIDFAKSAIDIIQSSDLSEKYKDRLSCSVGCAVNDEFPVPDESQDLVLLMFVLSAISPEYHEKVIRKISRVLKPGGKLLIRDYGRYDEAQLRFGKGAKIDDNFYVRADGTCAFYFDIAELNRIVTGRTDANIEKNAISSLIDPSIAMSTAQGGGSSVTSLEVEDTHYILRQYANRQQKNSRHRVWIHAKYVKR